MTIIAWDGKTLAADKRMVNVGHAATTTKIFRSSGKLIGVSGDLGGGLEMLAWIEAGAIPDKLPAQQRNEKDWVLVVVIDKDGLRFYERSPYAIHPEDPIWACGSGRDYALAAMYLGKTAREACEIACHFETGCGNGIDELRL